ncbi:MAG TPA: hypothetical protein VH640_16490 [Bryobacteraceae bacterium]|jgi:hypothetical protein
MVSIWFLIGILLAVYGLIIAAEGVYEYFAPLANAPVLANLHASLWWGLFILALGGFYCWHFHPGKTK